MPSRAALGLALLLVWLEGAQAAVVRKLSLRQLVTQAELIAIVRPLAHVSRWDSNGRIVTYVSLRIERMLKDDRPDRREVRVTVLGGSIGELGLVVPGAARFPAGQRCIVFLYSHPNGGLRVVGMSQGTMPIREQAQGPVVTRSTSGLALLGADGQIHEADAQEHNTRSLSEVVAQLVALIGASG
ncbi:MAG: hypothetical protein MJD61_14115 [Proteobacteria bacterium]|nr:hypothetical protein [Pseudomonadota bacterium]